MATLEQILNYRNLTGVIRSIKSGVPNPLPAEFLTPGRKVSGNRAEYFKITGTRQVARLAHYGSPAKRRELRDVALVPVQMIHAFESQQWPLALTLALTKMTDLSKDERGEQQAEYQSREFKKLFSNLRVVAAAMALLQGIIYVDTDGNILPSSSGAAWSIDFGIPAGNKGTLNWDGNGAIISANWSSASTDIITQLMKIRTASVKLTGYEIEEAFYGDSIPGWIAANTTAQQYLKLNPAMNQALINTPTAVPNGFGGIKRWTYAGQSFFADSGNVNRTIMAAGNVVFTPAYDPEWFEVMEGSFPVPRTVLPAMGASAAEVLANVAEEFGMFAYGQLSLNPPMVEQYAGDTFLPVLKVPSAVFQATVG